MLFVVHILTYIFKNTLHKNSVAMDALKREENLRHHQISVLKQTHETQLEIKNALIQNLEDIIDEQETRIFYLESCFAGYLPLFERLHNSLLMMPRFQDLMFACKNVLHVMKMMVY